MRQGQGAVVSFSIGTEIYAGRGALERLVSLGAERVLLVADPAMRRLGIAEQVERPLRAEGAETAAFEEITPDPSLDLCRQAHVAAQAVRPQAIVAVGGGSAIDLAKAVWTLLETPGATLETLLAAGFSPPPRERGRIRLVAIPSTSGAGSEVGRVAVLTDHAARPPVKQVLFTGAPDVALVDPALADLMPPALAAESGYDALAHAVEAFVSVNSHELARSLAAGAARSVMGHLPASVRSWGDEQCAARERMHLAATMAGATMRVGLGLCHALAHQITPLFGVPHGRANAIVLPHVMRFNAPVAGEGYADLAARMGLDRGVGHVVEACEHLRAAARLPASLQEAGITREALEMALPVMVERALRDVNAPANPRPPRPDDVRALYWCAWEGR